MSDELPTQADMDRTRATLVALAARQDRLRVQADGLGLTGVDRFEWLMSQRTEDERTADARRWGALFRKHKVNTARPAPAPVAHPLPSLSVPRPRYRFTSAQERVAAAWAERQKSA